MSELISTRSDWNDFRRRLFASVSVAALVASVYASGAAFAENDADRPTVWIELGGQLEQIQGGQEPFAPPFVANLPKSFFSPLSVQKPPQYSFGGEGAISFEPEGNDWVFSASVRFGRSNGVRQQHQQTPNAKVPVHFARTFPPPFSGFDYSHNYSFYPFGHVKFENATAQQSETHAILDFQVGKDVGLGIFGIHGSSVLSAGVRIAQFTSKTNVSLRAEPDVHYLSSPIASKYELNAFKQQHVHFHDYAAMLSAQRSFRGLGPSIAWNGSAPFVGNPERGEITLDWGANAAVLFGRQKVRGRHQSSARGYYNSNFDISFQGGTPHLHVGHEFAPSAGGRIQNLYAHTADINRVRTVVVPNLGGIAGLSFRYSNAKLSFGYRADFFFDAMDGGIDTPKSENRGFFGPFATISIGLP